VYVDLSIFILREPPGFKVNATVASGGSVGSISGIENKDRKLYGLQFHPEVSYLQWNGYILNDSYFSPFRFN
jgi:anthranilate/para-aminobenzoate synthase component II